MFNNIFILVWGVFVVSMIYSHVKTANRNVVDRDKRDAARAYLNRYKHADRWFPAR